MWISGALYSEQQLSQWSHPQKLENLQKLNQNSVRGNQLTGNISEVVGDRPNLEYIDLSYNSFHEELSHNRGSLDHLDLSANRLNGSIPANLGDCSNLYYLNLSNNRLSHRIPEKFIPKAFEDTRGLSDVEISSNQLQGPIPNSKAFRDATIEVLKVNNGLCGNVKGLQPCKKGSGVGQPAVKKGHKIVFIIIFPLLGALLLLLAFIGIFLVAERRERTPEIEEVDVQNDLSSISTFDGRTMYGENIKATKDFDPMYCIGKGGHGSIYKAELPSGNIVAVKKLHPSDIDMANQRDFLKEVRAPTEIKHRNIVKLLGFCSHPRHSFLVYEYLERGSQATILSREAVKKLVWATRINIIKGMAHALSYMHHDCLPLIVHRHNSSSNILLDSQHEPHISDFGTAKLLKLDSSNQNALAGTFRYVAPGICSLLN
ncbi:MDIS1-interacting receptor like kinase 2-like [Vitis riparia]|uniref:MDIS1-interacting receptor like kinase 2-like n=1 Tax=Vitis riparia TaxID=96939 RepID=UPI00155A16F9|nr:MDIS1-interacting receptor like kinase 2-like [Vitis riparia]